MTTGYKYETLLSIPRDELQELSIKLVNRVIDENTMTELFTFDAYQTEDQDTLLEAQLALLRKPRYKTNNWKQYNQALINRGSLTFWIDEEAISEWKQGKQNKRGRPRVFSDLVITTALMVKRIFSMPLRASQGFIDSVFRLAQVPLSCPHYSCISRHRCHRSQSLW